jgi:hypothetical protein
MIPIRQNRWTLLGSTARDMNGRPVFSEYGSYGSLSALNKAVAYHTAALLRRGRAVPTFYKRKNRKGRLSAEGLDALRANNRSALR